MQGITALAGQASLVMLWLSLLTGLAVRNGWLPSPARSRRVAGWHAVASALGLGLGLGHGVTELGDPRAGVRALDLAIPFLNPNDPVGLGAAVLGTQLVVAVAASAVLQRLLGKARWRALHGLGYVALMLLVAHILISGRDTTPAVRLLALVVWLSTVGMWAVSLFTTPTRPHVERGRRRRATRGRAAASSAASSAAGPAAVEVPGVAPRGTDPLRAERSGAVPLGTRAARARSAGGRKAGTWRLGAWVAEVRRLGVRVAGVRAAAALRAPAPRTRAGAHSARSRHRGVSVGADPDASPALLARGGPGAVGPSSGTAVLGAGGPVGSARGEAEPLTTIGGPLPGFAATASPPAGPAAAPAGPGAPSYLAWSEPVGYATLAPSGQLVGVPQGEDADPATAIDHVPAQPRR